jgi:NMD protein affecting ribosome stability and mRNA decay
MPSKHVCENCGASFDEPTGIATPEGQLCPECYWPMGKPVDTSLELCSICRRRHKQEEGYHAAE